MRELSQEKRSLVLAATLELISEQGFFQTSMAQIAKKANIAVGTIYLYFPNKEALINTLYIEIKSSVARNIMENSLEEGTIKERLLRVFKSNLDYYIEHPREFIFTEQYFSSSLITEETKKEGAGVFHHVREIYKQGQNEKIIKDLQLDVLISVANGATFSLVKLWLFGNKNIERSQLYTGIESIWDAIKV